MSGRKGSSNSTHRYPRRSTRTQPRSSDRLKKRSLREFVLPDKSEILANLVPEGTSPKNYRDLRPRRLINDFVKERNRYNNPDGIDLFDDDPLADFIADEDDDDDNIRQRRRRRRRKQASSESEWEQSDDAEYSEGSAFSESDDILDDSPENEASVDSEDDDGEPAVKVTSSDDDDDDDNDDDDENDSDVKSISSTEEFMTKRVKKSLRKLPKRVNSSTWWKTTKGSLSSNTKNRRPLKRTPIDGSDDSDEESSRPAKHHQKRLTFSDDEDERPSCSKEQTDKDRTSKKGGSIGKRTLRPRIKRIPVIAEEHDSEEDDDISATDQKASQRVKSAAPIREEKITSSKSKAKKQSLISSSENSSDEENTSPGNQATRNQEGKAVTKGKAKKQSLISSSEDSDQTNDQMCSQQNKLKRAAISHKRSRPSIVSSTEESSSEAIILESSTIKGASLTEKEKIESSSSGSGGKCPRSAKRHKRVLDDDEEEEEEEKKQEPDDLEEEMDTSDDLGNHVGMTHGSKSSDDCKSTSAKPGAVEQSEISTADPICLASAEPGTVEQREMSTANPTCSDTYDKNKEVDPTVTTVKDLQRKECEVREQIVMQSRVQNMEGEGSGDKGPECSVSTNKNKSCNESNTREQETEELGTKESADKESEVANQGSRDLSNKNKEGGDRVANTEQGISLGEKENDAASDRSSKETEGCRANEQAEIGFSGSNDIDKFNTLNNEKTADSVPGDANVIKDEEKTVPAVDDYDSDDSVVECPVPPKTPPLEITLSSDEEPASASNVNVTSASNSGRLPMQNTFNSNGSGSGFNGTSFSGNAFALNHQSGFSFGGNTMNSHIQQPTTRATCTAYGIQTGNIPNHNTTDQFGMRMQQSSMFNRSNVRTVFSTAGANTAFPTPGGFPTGGANAGFGTTGTNAGFATTATNGGFPTTGASACFPTSGSSPGFQAQHHPNRNSSSWAQMSSNNQAYQSLNRPQMAASGALHQSLQNVQTGSGYNTAGISPGGSGNPSNFQTVNRMQLSQNSAQFHSLNNAVNRTGGVQSSHVNSAGSLPQFQQSFSRSSRMSVGPTWTTATRTRTTGGFSFGTNRQNGQVQAIAANYPTESRFQRNPVLRTLLKTNIASNTRLMKKNGMNIQQFQTPNGLQMSSVPNNTTVNGQNYQATNRFQSTVNYIQPSSFSSASGEANITSGRQTAQSNYQPNQFSMSVNNVQHQSLQGSSGMGSVPTGSVQTNQNYQMVNGTKEQGSSVQFQSMSATVGGQPYAGNQQFSNRTQMSGNYQTHNIPNSISPASHVGMIQSAPNSQLVNRFQRSANNIQPQALPAMIPGGNRMMGNVQNSQSVERFQMSGGSVQPQSFQTAPTAGVGSSSINQPLDRLTMFTNSIHQQTANVTQRGCINSAQDNLSPNRFQLPVNNIQQQNLPNGATSPGPFTNLLNHFAHRVEKPGSEQKPNILNAACPVGSAASNFASNGYRVRDNNMQVQQQTVPNATPMNPTATAQYPCHFENSIQTPCSGQQQVLSSANSNNFTSTVSVAQPASGLQVANVNPRHTADTNPNGIFTTGMEKDVERTQVSGVFTSPSSTQSSMGDGLFGDNEINALSPASAIWSQVMSNIPVSVTEEQNIFHVEQSRQSNLNAVAGTQNLSNENGALQDPPDETDGVCLSAVEDQSTDANSGISSKETRTECSPVIHTKETWTSEGTSSECPPKHVAPKRASGNSSESSHERSQGIVNNIDADVSIFKQPAGKPVVILRDILSQIKSVKFDAARQTINHGERSRIHIQPGKRFLVKEKSDNKGLDIIDQNTDTTIVIEGNKDLCNTQDSSRLTNQSTHRSSPELEKCITNGCGIDKQENNLNSKQLSTVYDSSSQPEQVNGHAALATGQDIDTALEGCRNIDNTASKSTLDTVQPSVSRFDCNAQSKQRLPIASDNNNRTSLLPKSQADHSNQNQKMLEILPVV